MIGSKKNQHKTNQQMFAYHIFLVSNIYAYTIRSLDPNSTYILQQPIWHIREVHIFESINQEVVSPYSIEDQSSIIVF